MSEGSGVGGFSSGVWEFIANAVESQRVRTECEILADVKKLAVEYHDLTGKPLRVAGETAEVEAAEKLGLTLARARTERLRRYHEPFRRDKLLLTTRRLS